jgi:regulation of enolase protein 1 (concanavalin A-like superfamily)
MTVFKPVERLPNADGIGKDCSLQWYSASESWTDTAGEDTKPDDNTKGWWKIENNKLLFAPPEKRDFWRKTYYEPLMVKDDASFLYSIVPQSSLPVTIETSFSMTVNSQFDQAGIVIRLDKEHWIKTGIEVVDEQPRLSCVVTNGFSDWSTQPWTVPALKLRVHILPQHGGSVVVEAAPIGTNEWSFIRIAHIHSDFNHDLLNDDPTTQTAHEGLSAPPGTLMVGIFAACPIAQTGMVATFEQLSITQGSEFVHNA